LKITVFICTYNRGKLISGTLQSIINNQRRKPDEIIIVNGGGENDCRDVLDKWKKVFTPLKIINTKNKNLASSRNIGLKKCDGDIIIQTDDDARPFPDWIEKIVKAHLKYPNCGVIGGRVVDAYKRTFLSKIADVSTFPSHRVVKKVRSVPGVNSSYKKEVLNIVGKYDETLFRGEDVDYNWRVKQIGWDILYHPEIKVKHIHRPTWKSLFYQHFMYGKAHYLVRKKWPEMYSHYPLRITSIATLSKLIASWTLIPFLDAITKSKKLKTIPNGFEILIIFLINISNRFGTTIEWWFNKND
tara:strand:+ start:311 stop:1210 length:900 start_codon:yes stop_codon:yes gene_type:complete